LCCSSEVIFVISSIPGSSLNTLAPYAPLGREPVSQETGELKSSSFKATEQPAESGRNQNKRPPDERPNDEAEQDRLGRTGANARPQAANQTANREEQQQRELQELQEIEILAARDREVRAHEQAHASVAGQYAGSPTYTYQRGPDGVSYAVGGEVSIDTSAIPGDPEATIRKAQQLQRAASAPADPSGQDRQVAAQAAQLEQRARAELLHSSSESELAANSTGESEEVQVAPSAEQDSGSSSTDELSAAEREERLREADEAKREEDRFAYEQLQLDQRRARAELFGQAAQKNIDLNRKLIDIGVFPAAPSLGGFLNQKV
jgi:hypothetical protein